MTKEAFDEKYEIVVGLEVHAQMLTTTKAYSGDFYEYGAMPNTQVSPVTLGLPGALPRMNKKTIEFAVRMGLACKSKIAEAQHFARKNYFYPDLPKGYQITQDTTPICEGGYVRIKDDANVEKNIGITRIHMEEDAGKSNHDLDPTETLVDLNRAGVPLIEIVSEPDISSEQEAYNYLVEIRKLLRYLEICDGNMEEGSMRCDVNISIRLKGSKVLNNRVEVKNINSFRNVMRAIEFEKLRQAEIHEKNGEVYTETRNFDAAQGLTISLRSKEGAHDYRYFPEPDLQPIRVTAAYVEKVRNSLPPLPADLFDKYTKECQLSDYDANNLTEAKGIALYYEEIIALNKNYKAAANWVMGEIKSYLNQTATTIDSFPISPAQIAELITLVDEGLINKNVASKKVFPALLHGDITNIKAAAEANGWIQEDASDEVEKAVRAAMDKFPDKVEAYKNGNKKLLGLFMGEVMKATKGKADPKTANALVAKILEE